MLDAAKAPKPVALQVRALSLLVLAVLLVVLLVLVLVLVLVLILLVMQAGKSLKNSGAVDLFVSAAISPPAATATTSTSTTTTVTAARSSNVSSLRCTINSAPVCNVAFNHTANGGGGGVKEGSSCGTLLPAALPLLLLPLLSMRLLLLTLPSLAFRVPAARGRYRRLRLPRSRRGPGGAGRHSARTATGRRVWR